MNYRQFHQLHNLPQPKKTNSVRSQRGASAVEFAIVLPLLLLVVFAVIDFGRYFFGQLVLESASAEAAKIAAVKPIDLYPTVESEIDTFIASRVSAVQALISLNSATATVTQTHCQSGSNQVQQAKIEICIPFRPFLPFNIAPTTDCPESESVHVIGAMVCQ